MVGSYNQRVNRNTRRHSDVFRGKLLYLILVVFVFLVAALAALRFLSTTVIRKKDIMSSISTQEQVTRAVRDHLPQLLHDDPSLNEHILRVARKHFPTKVETEDRFTQVLNELIRIREEQARKWEEQKAEDKRNREEQRAEDKRRWDEQNRKWDEQNRNGKEQKAEDKRKWEEQKAEDKRRWDKQNRKWEEQNRNGEEQKAEDKRKWEEQKAEDKRKWDEQKAEDRRRWEEQNRKWEEQNRKWDEKMAEDKRRWDEQNSKWEKQNRKWDEKMAEDKRRWDEQNSKWEESNRRFDAVGNQIKRSVGALGARWGIQSEKTFRNALAGILTESFGVEVINVNEFDEEGEVLSGRPGPVEIDVIIKNGVLILCELKSSLSRPDMSTFERKVRFYERRHQRKASRVIVISPMIDEQARQLGEELGIEMYSDSLDVPV
uniref:PD-(D/E)XK nuclease superfamily protein n=1 Tax=Candidatus Kentrum sp. DK TaxID=2126562 RepID=A0A450S0P4_9GAMM|nr:MAG: hypothetical protein BECKDK2373C_GA0170839_101059 [Candidatus Kentron sp. DK]